MKRQCMKHFTWATVLCAVMISAACAEGTKPQTPQGTESGNSGDQPVPAYIGRRTTAPPATPPVQQKLKNKLSASVTVFIPKEALNPPEGLTRFMTVPVY